MNAQSLIQSFNYTADVIHNQLKDITHEESLVQPIKNGHSINWLLGHIVSARSVPLQRVNAEAVWSDDTRARYRNGSDPIGTDEARVLKLPQLLNLFDQTQTRLVFGLQSMTDDHLRTHSGYGKNSIYESFLYFHFHETYHLGQLTMIAEYLGKPSAYITLNT